MNRQSWYSYIGRGAWFKRRIHISWLIAWASAGVLAGVALAAVYNLPGRGAEWLIIATGLVVVVCMRRAAWMVLFVLLAGMIVGVQRGGAELQALSQYEQWYGSNVTVRGNVSEDPTHGPSGDLRLRLNKPVIDDTNLTGTVWISLKETPDIKRGDTVTAKGFLVEGFGNIPAVLQRAEVQTVERPYPGDIGRRLRDWFSSGVYQAIPEPQAGLGMAYLVGQKNTLDETISEQFRTVGLIHAVVASGFHLTVLVMLVRKLLEKQSKYLSTVMAGGMIAGFIMITGFSPSMSRAGLISGLSLLAWYYGRVVHPMVLLPFAAAVTVLIQPSYVWGDIGWYLSFAAFAGVIILAPLLHDYFWGANKKPGFVRALIITTIAAQLVTLPLTIFVFEYYSIYSLLANLLVVPLVSLTMLLVFMAGVVGLALPSMAATFGAPADWIMRYMIHVVDWISSLPGAKSETTMSAQVMIASYAVIILFGLFLWRQTKHDFRTHDTFI